VQGPSGKTSPRSLPDGPRILDCLEFDDRLRWIDQLDDVAFLAMDLEYLGRPDLAEQLLERYASCAHDAAPANLSHHYIAYRALVRARVAAIRATETHRQTDDNQTDDTQPGDRPDTDTVGAEQDREAADQANRELREHLKLARRHLAAGTVRLVLIGGLPGTGKSTLAAAVADQTGLACCAVTRSVSNSPG
jgi:hypothetical protein